MKLDESFDVRTDGSDDRFELRGELDMATVRHFLDAVQPAIESARDVTLDLSRLTFMDSTGISVVRSRPSRRRTRNRRHRPDALTAGPQGLGDRAGRSVRRDKDRDPSVCCLTDVAPRLDNDRGRFLGSLGSRRGHRGPRTTFGAARPSSGRAAPSISRTSVPVSRTLIVRAGLSSPRARGRERRAKQVPLRSPAWFALHNPAPPAGIWVTKRTGSPSDPGRCALVHPSRHSLLRERRLAAA